jgi:exopolysaccharide biosynthesis polyprenyl glycosylphosphotransferase
MLSRQHIFYQRFLQLVDAVLLGASLWAAHAIRFYILTQVVWFDNTAIEAQYANCAWMVILVIVIGPLALDYFGLYQNHPPLNFSASLWAILRGLGLMLLVIITSFFVFRVPQPTMSRTALGLFPILGLAVLAARVALFHLWLRLRGSRAHLRQYILLCGLREDRNRWKERFLSLPGKDFEVKAEFDLRQEGVARMIETLHEEAVDIVVFTLDEHIIPQVREALLACEAEGVEAWVSADFIQTLFTHVQFDQFAGQPLLIYRTAPPISWELIIKRLLDVIAGGILLILMLPPMLVIAIIIRLTSPGPAIFSQNRSGLHGRSFRMYKFRTMTTNAEQDRAELEERNEMSGPVFKVENDPRVTPVGRWLRRTSLDELPQLWNVLRGEMSLVGPRPLPLHETASFGDVSQRRRMSVRPGLTCLWQVRGRNQISDFKDWVRLDLEYIDRWSLWLDIKILLRTVPAVIFGWGAK